MSSDSEKDLFFKAKTTEEQVTAIARILKVHHQPINELRNLKFTPKVKKAKDYKKYITYKWLKNSWNTEKILRITKNMLENNENHFFLQWSFPQAYYSVFSSVLAYFKTTGATEESHQNVLKKFGELCKENKYPNHINFCAIGHYKEIEFINFERNDNKHSPFYVSSKSQCEHEIKKALKTTREHKIVRKRNELANSFKKANYKENKVNLSYSEWGTISNKVPPTSILDYLYRKRIKSNYDDIDTFIYEDIPADTIHKSLVSIVSELNLVNEFFIMIAIGKDEYKKIIEKINNNKQYNFVEKRLSKML